MNHIFTRSQNSAEAWQPILPGQIYQSDTTWDSTHKVVEEFKANHRRTCLGQKRSTIDRCPIFD
eukprot:scaffold2868_cov171-Amphora_coffeaeformis.AAC.7